MTLSDKIILIQSDNGNWYSYFFKDCIEYHKSGYKTLDSAIQTMKNMGNDVVLIMDKNKNKINKNEFK